MLLTLLAVLGTAQASPVRRSIPSGYLKPYFGQSQSNIYSDIAASFTSLIQGVKSDGSFSGSSGELGGWQGQNGWTQVAQYDKIMGTTTYAQTVHNAQYTLAGTSGAGCDWNTAFADCYNDDNGWAALALIEAYDAYGNQQYLTWAEELWQFTVGNGYIDQEDINAGHLVNDPWVPNQLAATCNGQSMLYGVTWKNNQTNAPTPNGQSSGPLGVNAVSTGLFALMGAELCGRTGNQTYCDRAGKSLGWIDNHLLNKDTGLIVDNIDMTDCTGPQWYFTYNQGLYLGAYAKLASLTGNAFYLSQATNAVEAAFASSAPWNSASGIISEGAGKVGDGTIFRAVLLRNLLNSYPYLSSATQADVLEYINIQYYGITQNASDNPDAPVNYSDNWQGPYNASNQNAVTQIAAMDVLNAVTLNPQSAYPSNTNKNVPVSHT